MNSPRSVCRLILLLLAVLGAAGSSRAEETLVDFGSSMRYVFNDVSDPGFGMSWTAPGFDDTGWASGSYGIGFDGEGTAVGLIPTLVPSGTKSVYTRATFNIDDITAVDNLFLGLDYDDGAVVWINGVEIYRSASMNALPLAWDAQPTTHESSNRDVPWFLPLADVSTLALPLLQNGENHFAAAVWNSGPAPSTDLVLVPQLRRDFQLSPVRGPYLQSGSHERVVVRWRTEIETESRVAFGVDPLNLIQNATSAQPTVDHEILLEGLIPDTRYYYAIGNSAGLYAGEPDQFFVTAPPPGDARPTRIWALGDSGTAGTNAADVRDAYYGYTGTQHTDLWLMLGDNAYQNGSDNEYQGALFDMYPDMLRKSVLWPTLGNHDTSHAGVWPYFDIFTLPSQGEAGGVISSNNAYYSFDYGNIHFVVLDSMFTDRMPGSPMLLWLNEDLGDTDREWIIVYWHHPPYSKGTHDSDNPLDEPEEEPLEEMRAYVIPILDAHGVDLVLSGHSHSYERSFLLNGHTGTSEQLSGGMLIDPGDGREDGTGVYHKLVPGPDDGIVYTVAGSSGKVDTGYPLDHPAMFISHELLGSVVLDINGNRLDAKFLDKFGTPQDWFSMVKGVPPVQPVANFQASPLQAGAPALVSFTDLSLNDPTLWDWDFDGDGSTDSNRPDPTHVYDQPGSYTVQLEVSNYAGPSTMLQPAYICVTGGIPDQIDELGFTPDPSTFAWQPNVKSTNYDVVKGDLIQLRNSGGDFGGSQLGCIENGGAATQSSDAAQPGSQQGFYYLVRGINCALQTGTFEASGSEPNGPRDLGLQGPGGSCACPAADDTDSDGWCTTLDNCPGTANPDQIDLDADGTGDLCDICPLDPLDDLDSDSICADADNCPSVPNPFQGDYDGDTIGDECDNCTDTDGDGLGNPGFVANICPLDNCPSVVNPPQVDSDADGVGDACDNCNGWLNTDQADLDNDQIGDVCDTCTDTDGDGFGNLGFPANDCGADNCPDHFNPTQVDFDNDGEGDTCDNCPLDPQNDSDSDFICDSNDNCPSIPNSAQRDEDGDGIGTACDNCTDSDNDGYGDLDFPSNSCPDDNCPAGFNPTQSDQDADGQGDICDPCHLDPDDDIDTDGLCGDVDNCPGDSNPDQKDRDEDALGDVCDVCPADPNNDIDGDTICGDVDNCPDDANTDQLNSDTDSLGDACDDDDDNDGVADSADCATLVPGVSQPPGAVGDSLRLGLEAGVVLSWTRPAQGHTTNVYAGSYALPGPFGSSVDCLISEVSGTQAFDSAQAVPGVVTYYMVAARNVCGGGPLNDGGGSINIGLTCSPQSNDGDGDGIDDVEDNCPTEANSDQADTDGDFIGDVCDPT